jgi:iron complex outermembrane receptor protein
LPNGSIPAQSDTWEEFEPKVSLTWGATEDLTIFGSWGVGFKSGGFNNQGSQATVDLFINDLIASQTGSTQARVGIQDRYEKETSSAFELGFKSSLADGRVQLEAAVFDNTVDDMQFFEFLVGPFGLLRIVENIDEVELQGFEIGMQAKVTDNFTLGLAYAATDSEITANTVRADTVGNDAPYTPDFTANVNLELDLPLSGDRNFVAGAYWSFVGDTWFHVVQAQQRTTLFDVFFPGLGTADYSLTKRDAYDTLNLRLGIEADNWSVTVFGNNITDEEYLEEVIPAPEFGGSFIHPGTQARYGVEASYRF